MWEQERKLALLFCLLLHIKFVQLVVFVISKKEGKIEITRMIKEKGKEEDRKENANKR